MGDEFEHRVSELESKMALLEQQIEHSRDLNRLLLDDMSRLLTRHDHILVGNDGAAGLVSDVSSLKQERIGERLKSLESTVMRWAGAVGLATVLVPVLIKLLWP